MNLCYKIAVSGDDCLDPGREPPGGPRHGVPVQAPHHLLDLINRGGHFLVRAVLTADFVTPNTKKVEKAAVCTALRSDNPLPDLLKVLLVPLLGLVAVVAVNRSSCWKISCCLVHQRFENSPHNVRILVGVYPEARGGKMCGGMTSPSLQTTAKTITWWK